MMDKRWRNLAFAVIILAIAIGAFFFLSQPKALLFSEGYAQLSALWEKNGVANSDLSTAADSDLRALEGDLLAFKSELAYFEQTKDISALNALVSIQLDMLEEETLLRQLGAKEAELSALSDQYDVICANLEELKSANSKSAEAISFISVLNEKINGFIEQYPSQASAISIAGWLAETGGMQQALQDAEAAVWQMDSIC